MLFYLFPFSELPPAPEIRARVCLLWWDTSLGLSVSPSSLWALLPAQSHVYEDSHFVQCPHGSWGDSERVSIGEKQLLWPGRFFFFFFFFSLGDF